MSLTPSRPTVSDQPGISIQLMVLLWCIWLLGSWATLRWQEPALRVDRWMVVAALVGLMAAWPTIRLSQLRLPPGRLAVRPGLIATRLRRQWQLTELVVEWLCLLLIFQAVIWPLTFVAQWMLAQAIWLNMAFIAWSSAAALFIGWGSLFGRSPGRATALAACLLLLLGEPAVTALLSVAGLADETGAHAAWGVSPLPTIWALSSPGAEFVLDPWRGHVIGMAGASAVGWLLLAMAARWISPPQGPHAAGLPVSLRSAPPLDRS